MNNKRRIKVSFVATLLLISVLQSFSTEYVFPEKLSIKPVTFKWENNPAIGLYLLNMSSRSFDSLELRIFLTGTVKEISFPCASDTITNMGARLDIFILYRTDGFQDVISGEKKMELLESMYGKSLHKMEDTYDSITKKYHWYLSIPLNIITLQSGCRLRLDLVWVARESTRCIDMLNQPPAHVFGETDWSYGSKKRSQGMPIEFSGIYNGTKADLDTNTHLSENPYIAVYRKGNLLWGVPPDWKKHYGNTIDTVKSEVPVSRIFENSITKREHKVKVLSGNSQPGFTIISDTPLKNASIINTAGKVIRKKSFSYTDNSTMFNVPCVQHPGIYFIELKFNNGDQLTKKMIVKN